MRLDSTSMTTIDVVKTALAAGAQTSGGEALAKVMLRGSEAADNNAVRALDAEGKLGGTLATLFGNHAKASVSDKAAFAKEAAMSLDGDAASRIAQSLDSLSPADVGNFARAIATHGSPASRNGYLIRELGEVKSGQASFALSPARLAGAADVLATQSGDRFTAALQRLLPDGKTLAPFNTLLQSNPKAAADIVKKIEAMPASPLKDAAMAAVRYNDADRIGLPAANIPTGQKTAEARALQDALVKLGLMLASDLPTKPGPSNYGPLTQAAVQKFQTAMGLPATGQFDATTRSLMGSVLSRSAISGNPNVPPQLANAVQEALVKAGKLDAKDATGNGIMGTRTDAALKAFQKSVGLEQNGILGPTTFQALFYPSSKGGKSQLPTTVADANKFFMNQFDSGKPAFNKDPGEVTYVGLSCGPTSVAMALAAVGVRDLAHLKSDITDMRNKMGKATGVTNEYHFVLAASKSKATAEVRFGMEYWRSAHGFKNEDDLIKGLTPEQKADYAAKAWSQMDTDLAAGKAIILRGDVTLAYAGGVFKDNNFPHPKLNPNPTNDTYGGISVNGKHIIAVIGKEGSKYLVADPLSRNGVVSMTKEQLATFFGANTKGINGPVFATAIGNPKTKGSPDKTPETGKVEAAGRYTAEQILAHAQNAMALRQTLIESGFSPTEATAIAANAQMESGSNPQAVQAGGGPGRGLFQWGSFDPKYDRRIEFQRQYNKPVEQGTVAEQIAYLKWEIANTEKGNWSKIIKDSPNAGEMAARFCRLFERPAVAARDSAERQAVANAMLTLVKP